MALSERSIKIKELIHSEVCMGTFGLVELELIELEKEKVNLFNRFTEFIAHHNPTEWDEWIKKNVHNH